MQTNDVIYAKTHAELLNKLLNANLKGYMRCTYALTCGYEIWLIRLNARESSLGWTNSLTDGGNTICEYYTGKPGDRLEYQKYLNPRIRRVVFDIFDRANKTRKYIFKGVFEYDTSSDNVNRVWKKVSDEYKF